MSTLATRPITHSLHYSQEVLNRVSFLRKDPQFIDEALSHSETQFIPFENYLPFVNERDGLLLRLRKVEVSSFLDGETSSQNFVFLGLLFSGQSNFVYRSRYRGTPTFALDISNGGLSQCNLLETSKPVRKVENFKDLNRLTLEDSSIVSQARMYLQWLDTHKFCSICGSKTTHVYAGTQLKCSNGDCASNKGVSNVCFPRTDPVVISAITNRDNSKVLLCRSGAPRNKDRKLYSCVSGFVDPSETLEVAVAREIWEETGLHTDKVEILVSQPWPFPNNLMIGCIAIADDTQVPDLTHDCELDEVRWVPCSVLEKILKQDDSDSGFIQDELTGLNLPNNRSVAHMLMDFIVKTSKKNTVEK
ncbi:LANO_0E04104g1_1 [Lachancea nothofagi CBS 11611]|uniref:NAD(+) diphosphatase n=1 Tax=Lachancea nothofagi CBS 11611 TaxID=1266666 RepID=A0A1G4JS56_9SACH|nr:LANO_0E04104g1_1 [Lachancea nothofagi CBS 11611]